MKILKSPVFYICILLFFFSFSVYLNIISPSVYFGDSGELISMAYTLGIPHPTGFSLYILLAKIFSYIPLANIAFRVNVLSAFFAALIPVLLFLIFNISFFKKQENKFIKLILPLFVSLVFIFSYTILSQAVAARVYTLNSFLCAVGLFLFFYYFEHKNEQKILYLLAFITGLGTGAHLSLIIFTVILWIYIFLQKFKTIKKSLVPLLIFLAFGLSINLFILIRAQSDLVLKWTNISSISDFFNYMTQKQYSKKMFSRDLRGYLYFFGEIIKFIIREFSWIGFVAIIAGMIKAFLNKYKYFSLFVILFLSNIILLSIYGNYTDLQLAFRYFIPSYIIAVFFIYYILFDLYLSIKSKSSSVTFISLFITILLIILITKNLRENDRSNNFIAYNYPHDILKYLPENANVFTNGDNQIYTIAYAKFVEKKYPHITIYDTTNTIFKDIEKLITISRSTNFKSNIFAAFSQKIHPIFSAVDLNTHQVRQAMHGLYIRLADAEDISDIIFPWYLYSLKNIIRDSDVFHEFEEREVIGFYLYRMAEFYKIKNKKNIYLYLLNKSTKIAYDSVPILTNVAIKLGSDETIENGALIAEKLFNKAVALQPNNDMVLFNIGSFYGRYGFYEKALSYFEKAIQKNPTNLTAKLYYNMSLKELKNKQKQEPPSTQTQNEATPFATTINNEHFEMGTKLLQQKKLKQAISEFSKDIEINPLLDRSYFHIGFIYSIKNEIHKAIPFYENALTKNPNNTSTLNNLGLCYYRTYNRQKAKECFEKSLKINPNQDRIKKLYDELK